MTDKLEMELLQKKVDELTYKNKLLNEIVLHYADPLIKWDKGEFARNTIRKIHQGYKPVLSHAAMMFKEKEVYPFVEFSNYIETEEREDE